MISFQVREPDNDSDLELENKDDKWATILLKYMIQEIKRQMSKDMEAFFLSPNFFQVF